MICSHCGLEYPDHLAECPNCHTPNDDIAAEVLTEDERDAFEGVTIDQVPDSDTYRVMDQDDLKQAQEEAKPFRLRVLNFLFGPSGTCCRGHHRLFGPSYPRLSFPYASFCGVLHHHCRHFFCLAADWTAVKQPL